MTYVSDARSGGARTGSPQRSPSTRRCSTPLRVLGVPIVTVAGESERVAEPLLPLVNGALARVAYTAGVRRPAQ